MVMVRVGGVMGTTRGWASGGEWAVNVRKEGRKRKIKFPQLGGGKEGGESQEIGKIERGVWENGEVEDAGVSSRGRYEIFAFRWL